MSNVIAYADVQQRLLAANLGVPIQWPNTILEGPEPPAPFLVVEISGGASRPIELGGSVWQGEGQVWVHVLVPNLTGPDAAFALVDAIMTVFRAPPLEPVVYTSLAADPGAPGEEDGNYWRTSVTADWRLQTFVPRS